MTEHRIMEGRKQQKVKDNYKSNNQMYKAYKSPHNDFAYRWICLNKENFSLLNKRIYFLSPIVSVYVNSQWLIYVFM
jgi:hypothetical protein